MSTRRPLLLGEEITARKHVDTGVRGRRETSLRLIRVRIDTTTTPPTILQGKGLTAVRNGVGDITVTFLPAFADVPTITTAAESSTFGRSASVIGTPTASSARIIRWLADPAGGATAEDGILTLLFVAKERP